MPHLAAERSFERGLVALAEGRNADAVDALRQAMDVLRQRGVGQVPARYLSYYGLGLARSGRPWQEAVDSCRAAVELEPSKPLYLLNLGRVYLLAGRATHAFECFRRGLVIAPAYRPLLEEIAGVERKLDVFPAVPRRAAFERAVVRARTAWPARSWKRRRTA